MVADNLGFGTLKCQQIGIHFIFECWLLLINVLKSMTVLTINIRPYFYFKIFLVNFSGFSYSPEYNVSFVNYYSDITQMSY